MRYNESERGNGFFIRVFGNSYTILVEKLGTRENRLFTGETGGFFTLKKIDSAIPGG